LALYIVSVSLQYNKLHPYEYVYFNELVGGLPGAGRNFETDYWGTSYKEAALWLLANFESSYTTVGICGNKEAALYFSNSPLTAVWLPNCEGITDSGAQYIIAYGRNAEWDKVEGTVIHTVSRDTVPLSKVFLVDQE